LAEHGLVHGDFNEFNLLIDDDENITIIDFPQMTSTAHPNAQYYFSRDVVCIQDFFAKRFGLHFQGVPQLSSDIDKAEDLDKEIKASGFANEEELKAMETIHEHYLDKTEGVEEEDDKESDDEAEEDLRDRKVRFQEDPELKKTEGDESSGDEEVVAKA
jgi:RIO kinase 2